MIYVGLSTIPPRPLPMLSSHALRVDASNHLLATTFPIASAVCFRIAPKSKLQLSLRMQPRDAPGGDCRSRTATNAGRRPHALLLPSKTNGAARSAKIHASQNTLKRELPTPLALERFPKNNHATR